MGYPTQKPILLLEQILEIASDKDDLILEPFCGSGTTLLAVKFMGRNYIGFDNNPMSIALTKERLENPIKISLKLLLKEKEYYETKTKEELKILKYLDCDIIQSNKGLDGVLKKNGSQVGVKTQKSSETLEEALRNLLRATKDKNFHSSILLKTKTCSVNIVVPNNIKLMNSLNSLI